MIQLLRAVDRSRSFPRAEDVVPARTTGANEGSRPIEGRGFAASRRDLVARALPRVVAELDLGLRDADVAVAEKVLDLLDADAGLVEERRRRRSKRVGGVAAALLAVGAWLDVSL